MTVRPRLLPLIRYRWPPPLCPHSSADGRAQLLLLRHGGVPGRAPVRHGEDEESLSGKVHTLGCVG